jgi:prepilin-type processing-associated H-X9-DG protein
LCENAPRPRNCRHAITRIEVAVVVVIFGAALCGLVVWIQQAREAGRRNTCANNLAQISIGLKGVVSHRNAFPLATVANEELPPEKRLSWYVEYSDDVTQNEELQIDRKKPWDAEENLSIRVRTFDLSDKASERKWREYELGVLPWLLCPSSSRDLRDIKPGPTSYVGIAGIGEDAASLSAGDPRAGVFGYERQTRPKDITRAHGNVLLLAETALDNGPWTAGGRPTVRGIVPQDAPCIGVGRQFGGNHPGGGNAAFVDGSVRFLSDAIDPDYFAAMATIAGEK